MVIKGAFNFVGVRNMFRNMFVYVRHNFVYVGICSSHVRRFPHMFVICSYTFRICSQVFVIYSHMFFICSHMFAYVRNMFAYALRLENHTAASVAVLQSAASPVC